MDTKIIFFAEAYQADCGVVSKYIFFICVIKTVSFYLRHKLLFFIMEMKYFYTNKK